MEGGSAEPDCEDPAFFGLLTEDDQLRYRSLQSTLRNSEKRYKRNKRV
jgi:hypothetical protein